MIAEALADAAELTVEELIPLLEEDRVVDA